MVARRTKRKDEDVTPPSPGGRLAAATAHYRQLAAALSEVGVVASGSLALRSHRCGKAGCRCVADPPRLHGPYWHLTLKVDGKTVNRRLSEQEAGRYREWIEDDRRLRELVDELRSVARQVTALTLGEEQAGPRV